MVWIQEYADNQIRCPCLENGNNHQRENWGREGEDSKSFNSYVLI